MKINNSTKIANEVVREVIQFCRPSGISNFDVEVRNSKYAFAGRAYYKGSGYHSTASPFIVVRVGQDSQFPRTFKCYQYGSQKGRVHYFANRIECLLYVMAHELRHLWQAKGKKKRAGMAYGARGRFSEVDTEAYALNKLRAWRNSK